MTDLIYPYVLGAFITGNLLGIWFESTIFLYIFSKIANKEIYAFDDLIDIIGKKSEYFADLLSCVWCLGTWVSIAVVFLISYFFNVSLAFGLACVFSWPFICAKIFKINE